MTDKRAAKLWEKAATELLSGLVGAALWMWLWNALLPDLFGAPRIDYLQSLGMTAMVLVVVGVARSYSQKREGG